MRVVMLIPFRRQELVTAGAGWLACARGWPRAWPGRRQQPRGPARPGRRCPYRTGSRYPGDPVWTEPVDQVPQGLPVMGQGVEEEALEERGRRLLEPLAGLGADRPAVAEAAELVGHEPAAVEQD